MARIILAALVCFGIAAGQSPTDVFDKAPPEIDKALRERLAKFMEAHVSGKFRLAEQVVHEDSQDVYYNAHKQKYVSYEVVKISYSENFTKAVVVTAVEMDWVTPRLGKVRVKPPLTTYWKLDAGEWWWYAIPQTEWRTPFGVMNPGEDPKPGVAPKWTVPNVAAVHKQVEASKLDIKLSSWEPSEDFAQIISSMKGEISLNLERANLPPGLSVTLSKTTLKAGESAQVHFKYTPPDRSVKTTKTVVVRVSPTNQTFPFNVTFAVPPEFEKYIPKQAPQPAPAP